MLPAITLPVQATTPKTLERDDRTPLRLASESEEQPSPELDVCVLQPLDFDASAGLIDAGQCLALHQRRRFGRQRGSISLDGNLPDAHRRLISLFHVAISQTESVLITSRLNAPLIQIIPDGSPPLPSSDGELNTDDNLEQEGGQATSPTGRKRLFYTNESNRGYQASHLPPRHPGDQQCRNSLPRVSLTSLGRAFTPRSSWNGSKAALLQLQRKSSRADGGGVPSYLAKKYHLSNDRPKEVDESNGQ